MATYRYIIADLLTNDINLELPMYGVTFNRELSKATNFTASVALGMTEYSDKDIIEGTVPGRSVLYIDRDGLLVFGGVFWSRTWQEDGGVFSFTGQSLESFLYNQVLTETYTSNNRDQRSIACDLINRMQNDSYANMGIQVPGDWTFAASTNPTVYRSVTWNDYSVYTIGKAMDEASGYEDGFDWYIDVYWDEYGHPNKSFKVDNPIGQPLWATNLVFDYPGPIKNFYWSENSASGATDVIGVGGGEGDAMLRSRATDQALLDTGMPRLMQIYSNKDLAVQSTLDSQTQNYLNQNYAPVISPTFEINSDVQPVFGSYGLGDYARFHLESRRFPDGFDVTSRVIGWAVTPTSSDNQESVKLVIEGEGDGDS